MLLLSEPTLSLITFMIFLDFNYLWPLWSAPGTNPGQRTAPCTDATAPKAPRSAPTTGGAVLCSIRRELSHYFPLCSSRAKILPTAKMLLERKMQSKPQMMNRKRDFFVTGVGWGLEGSSVIAPATKNNVSADGTICSRRRTLQAAAAAAAAEGEEGCCLEFVKNKLQLRSLHLFSWKAG